MAGDPRDAFVLGAERRWDGTEVRAPRRRGPAARFRLRGGRGRPAARAAVLRRARHAGGPRAAALQLGRPRLGHPPRAGRCRAALPELAARVRRAGPGPVGGRGDRRGVRARRVDPPRDRHDVHDRRDRSALRERRAQARCAARASRAARRSAHSGTPNPSRARMSPPRRPAPCATATTGSSTARRCSRVAHTSRSTSSSSPAPIPRSAKHRGLTMFLVPLDTPGIEIQPDPHSLRRAHQRDVLRRRARPGPLPRRPRERRVVGDPPHARPRARGRDQRRRYGAPRARRVRGRLGPGERPLVRSARARAARLRRPRAPTWRACSGSRAPGAGWRVCRSEARARCGSSSRPRRGSRTPPT